MNPAVVEERPVAADPPESSASAVAGSTFSEPTTKAHYILLIECESGYSSVPTTTCKIKGLNETDFFILKDALNDLKINSSTLEETQFNNFFEIDAHGFELLNILSNSFNYRLATQSMVIEKGNVGSRIFQVKEIVWTLERKTSK